MRIICPNCDAQYEVPDDAIPDEGRDVQCSNCGMTWMETPAAAKGTGPALVAQNDAFDEVDEPTEAPAQMPRKEIDPEVADILRQEAAREQHAREMERGTVETQPDLGLDSADVPASGTDNDQGYEDEDDSFFKTAETSEEPTDFGIEPREDETAPEPEDVSDLDGNEPYPGNVGEAGAAAAALGSRKELLPDIEEINSSLQSNEDRDLAGGDLNPETPVIKRKKRGFRRGFTFALLLFVIALLIYVFAPQIAAAVPQADPVLSQYVSWVDGLRAGLDGQVQGFLTWLDETAASTSN